LLTGVHATVNTEIAVSSFDTPDKHAAFAVLLLIAGAVISTTSSVNASEDEGQDQGKPLTEDGQRFEALADAAFEGILISQKELILDTNSACAEMFGTSKEQLRGRSLTNLIADESRVAVEKWHLAGSPEVLEARCLRGDGTTFWCELRQRITSVNGTRLHITSLRDIPERKPTGEAFRIELNRLMHAASVAPSTLYAFRLRPDGTTCLPYVGPGFSALFGVSAEDVAEDASPAFARLHPDDLPQVYEATEKSVRTLSPWRAEARIRHPERGDIWVEGQSSAPQREADGSILWYGSFTEITQRRQAEAAQRERDELNRAVLNSVRSHVAVLDRDGTILEVNQTWQEFARQNDIPGGAAARPGVGANYLEVLRVAPGDVPDEFHSVYEGIVGVIEGSVPSFTYEYRCDAPDAPRWFLMSVTPLASRTGGAVVSHLDVTERRRVEEERAYVMDRARCLLWHATVTDTGHPDYLQWDIHYPSIEVCQRFLPLTLKPGQSYLSAQYKARFKEDRVRCEALGIASIRAGKSYEQEFRTRAADGSIHWLHEALRVETIEADEKWRVVAVCTDITERKQADELLHSVMESARCLLWSAEVLLLDASAPPKDQMTWRFLHFDDAAAQRLLPLDVPLGASYSDVSYRRRHPDDLARTDRIGAENLLANRDYSQEFRVQAMNGEWRWHREDVRVKTVAPARWYVVGVTVDITERKRAEEALQRQREFLRSVIDTGPHYIFVKDAEGVFTLANRKVAESYGTTVEILEGKTDADFNPDPAVVAAYREADRRTLAALGETFVAEEPMPLPKGGVRWLETWKRPILSPEGDHYEVLGVASDITARKEAEEALRNSEQRLTHAQAIAHLGYIDVDTRTGQRYWSDEMFRILGYEPQSFEPTPERFFSRVHPDDLAALQQAYRALMDLGMPSCTEHRIIRPSGEVRWVHGQREVIFDSDGVILRYLGTILDITDRKQAELALRESQERENEFLRDVMHSVTEGRFHLCDERAALPPPLGSADDAIALTPEALQTLRNSIEEAERAAGFPEARQGDLMTAANEAAMNAIVHAGGGKAWVGWSDSGTVQVWIEDTGTGILLEQLPRATLERGFTTAGTMGLGFWLILQYCDRIFLLTGPNGTTVVLERDTVSPLPPWLAPFA
jgi:PAS domain S-box-containing protein